MHHSRRQLLAYFLALPALLSSLSYAQNWKDVYNPMEVRSLYLQVDPTDWTRVINDQPEEGNTAAQERANAWFNETGEDPILVEIRRKGATDPVLTSGGLTKVSLKIDINGATPDAGATLEEIEALSNQRWNGLRKLSLEIGNTGGPLDEGFGWQVHRLAAEAGYYNYDAANAAWVKLYVNGNFHGVFSSTEQRDEQFLRNRDLYSQDNTWLYKVDGGITIQEGTGDSPTLSHLDFVPFVKSGGSTPPNLDADLPQWIDMDSMLTLGACNAYLENTDGLFKNNGKNSFAADFLPANERLRMYFPWDLDTSIKQTTENIYGNFFENDIIEDPWFRRVYEHILRELIEGPLSTSALTTFLDDLQVVLAPELASDPFISAGTGSFDNLRAWVAARNTNVLGQLALPYVARPSFDHPGGEVLSGLQLTMTATTGNIYYTTDGTDPRVAGDGISTSATLYTTPVSIDQNTQITARTLDSGNWSGLSSKIDFQIASFTTTIRISEIMYNPKDPNTGDSIDNDQYEYIELLNTGATAVDLSGFFFDGITYTFPPGTMLASGARYLLVRNTTAFAAKYPSVSHDGIYLSGLSNGGEKIRLKNGNGTTVISVDYNDDPPWVLSPDGMGYSLVNRNLNGDPDDAANWSASSALEGSPGTADPALAYSTNILFNEVIGHSDPPYEDAIELINSGSSNQDISGWYLSDDARDINGDLSATLLKKYRIPNGTTINANDFSVFYQRDFNENNPLVPFGLTEYGERVYLSSSDLSGNLTGHVIAMDFPATDTNDTYGRVSTSDGFKEAPLQTPTFGISSPSSVSNFRNGDGAPNAAPRIPIVVISEIMYNPLPSGSEFVELHNTTSSTVDISSWDIDGISGFSFPANTDIDAGGFVVIVDLTTTTVADFRTNFNVPAAVDIFGAIFNLNNGGESLVLEKPNPDLLESDILIDKVRYNDKAPWPTEADGTGPSLERLPPTGFGQEPLSWKAPTIFGTPGTLGIVQTGLAITKGSFWNYIATASTPSTSWMQTDYNDSAWPSASGPSGYGETFIAGTVPYGPDASARYTTTYFRKSFSITESSANIDTLQLSVLYDDGAIIYLNGVEIARRNMPGSGVDYSTYASTDIEATLYEDIDLSAHITSLTQGENVLAVELHQSSASSPDLVWDAELTFTLAIDANDIDGDDMPAAWEAANGLDDTNPLDALLDKDGDGKSNLDEYHAGTDPQDPDSFFDIDSFINSGGDWLLTWDSIPGKAYRVHYSGDLSNWFNFGAAGDILATEPTIQFTDPSTTLPDNRFYRIEVIVP